MSRQLSTVMIVDDTEANIDILVKALDEHYDLMIAINGQDALDLMEQETPDIVLLDIMMPGMNGYEVLEKIKKNERTQDVPVIFLSAMSETKDKTRGFELGAVDFVTKPFEIPEMKARLSTHLELKEARERLLNQNELLEVKVMERTKELESVQNATFYCMAAVAETRDPETGAHLSRTQSYAKAIGDYLLLKGEHPELIQKEYLETLYKSVPMHDIGKVGMPDRILLKPGKLTDEEFEEMKRHTIYGKQILDSAQNQIKESQFLEMAAKIAIGHHEKWDGSGYPYGLSGEGIPLEARIMALVDVYDALINKRVYKPAFTLEMAKQIIIEGRGTHFDPKIVDAFIACEKDFHHIAEMYRDQDEAS